MYFKQKERKARSVREKQSTHSNLLHKQSQQNPRIDRWVNGISWSQLPSLLEPNHPLTDFIMNDVMHNHSSAPIGWCLLVSLQSRDHLTTTAAPAEPPHYQYHRHHKTSVDQTPIRPHQPIYFRSCVLTVKWLMLAPTSYVCVAVFVSQIIILMEWKHYERMVCWLLVSQCECCGRKVTTTRLPMGATSWLLQFCCTCQLPYNGRLIGNQWLFLQPPGITVIATSIFWCCQCHWQSVA